MAAVLPPKWLLACGWLEQLNMSDAAALGACSGEDWPSAMIETSWDEIEAEHTDHSLINNLGDLCMVRKANIWEGGEPRTNRNISQQNWSLEELNTAWELFVPTGLSNSKTLAYRGDIRLVGIYPLSVGGTIWTWEGFGQIYAIIDTWKNLEEVKSWYSGFKVIDLCLDGD